MRLVWPVGEDAFGVCWSLYATPRGTDWVPMIATRGSASIRADLQALSPYLAKEVRERWVAKLREALDLHMAVVPASSERGYAQEMRNVAVRAIEILEGGQ